MKDTNVNSRYRREKLLAQRLGVAPVVASGSRWEHGREDAEDMYRLLQFKSTSRNALSVNYVDLYQLRQHAQKKFSAMICDFVSPSLVSSAGFLRLPEDQWVCIPLAEYQQLFQAWQEKISR